MQDQRTELQEGIDVIVSTPGRLIDLIGKKLVRLDRTKVFILDEADKAVDIEMENQIRTVDHCCSFFMFRLQTCYQNKEHKPL